ncbi:acetyltransferase [Peribacillus simplex]|uniref:acetyltransferase n=1 Tax=Peribacillus simplex TaxID=1478 RepID=UPI00119F7F1F|nr:acetyltransferase [Peribacillus simplex]
MRPIIVIGEGGHSKVIQDIIKEGGVYKIIAILDDKYKKPTKYNDIVIGPVSYAMKLIQSIKAEFIIAIGNNAIRKRIACNLIELRVMFATVIHPNATVSTSAHIEEGTVVMAGSVINAEAVIGRHVIINSGAIVEHDNRIGDYAHVSPGAVLTGIVQVGEGTHVGARATVIPGKKIGNWSIIGAGATVVKDIPDYVTAVGLPAKVMKYLN